MAAEQLKAPAQESQPELFKLDSDRTDLGRADTLRFNVLTWVLDERYDKAIQELKDFLQKPSEFPSFHDKITRYIGHSIDLIYAIKAKRNFPGINSLTRAKQQELREKFKEHFQELQYILKKVEKAEHDLKVEDARSTIYVVRALWFALISVVVFGFALEITRGLAVTTEIVFEDIIIKGVDGLFRLIGM